MPPTVRSALLHNALDSIRIGVEDLETGIPSRSVSALRSVHAGLLLLIKEVLVRMSPPGSNEVLIKDKIRPVKNPDGSISFIGVGKKTIDVVTMSERCESLKIYIDWKTIRAITDSRNEAEHHSTSLSPGQIQTALAKSYKIIQQILVEYLQEDPVEVLSSIWSILLKNSEVFDAARQRAISELAEISWNSPSLHEALLKFPCPNCSAELLGTDIPQSNDLEMTLICRSCGEEHPIWEIGGTALSEYFGSEIHFAIKDGGDVP